MKTRLDVAMQARGLVASRSEAESWIRLGKVEVNGQVITKPGYFVDENTTIKLKADERYVSRAGLKLASVAGKFGVDFRGKIVLDVGSSTGGFTDYALQHGAAKVIAVDVGTDQLHPSLRDDPRVELYEKTDIRSVRRGRAEPRVRSREPGKSQEVVIDTPHIVVIDVSFISLREILPHVSGLMTHGSVCLAMLKPQFEAGRHQVNKGVIKNDAVRREILHDFELWARRYFVILDKADSDVHGAKGNRERFYALTIAKV
ncbi:MAG: TlyA family RNA methyltransferase [Candidatus Saccharimonadales bacterium]